MIGKEWRSDSGVEVEETSQYLKEQDEEDDELELPSDTLALLQDFYGERDNRAKRFEELKEQAEDDFQGVKGQLSMEDFTEDWNASQFWYNDSTATALAEELLRDATDETSIAVVSAPSVFIQVMNLLDKGMCSGRPTVKLLEFDQRFEVFKEFVMYDFEHRTRLPGELKGKFDRIICDPPFLSDDCQTKAALTVRWLAKDWSAPNGGKGLRFIQCTGERMADLIQRLYGKIGVQTTNFEVQHSNQLNNEFRCYANFESERWSWIER